MSYDQNSSSNDGGTPLSPPTQPPLSWYAAISSMARGALERGSGRGVRPVPADRSITNTNTNIISHSSSLALPLEDDSGASSRSFAYTTTTAAIVAASNSTNAGAGTAGRPRSIPISFLINHTPEPHLSPRIPEYPSFSASSSSLSSLSSPSLSSTAEAEEWVLSSSTASSESPSLTPAQIRRSPRSMSAATIPLVGASTPASLATMAGASASYYRTGVRGSVQRLSQSYHHFSPQSAQSRSGNSRSGNSRSGNSNSSNNNNNNSSNDSNSVALSSPSTQAINAEQVDTPVFSTTHHARSRSTYSDSGGSRAFSHSLLSRNDNSIHNSFSDSSIGTRRGVKDDSYNNGDGDNGSNNNSNRNSDNNCNNCNNCSSSSAAIRTEPRDISEAERQVSIVSAAQRTTSVSSPFEEDRLLEEHRVWRSPSTAPSVKARALFSAGKGATSDGDYSHQAIKTEQEESTPPFILSPKATDYCGPSCSTSAVSTNESSLPIGGSKTRPKPKRTKTGKILQKPKKITASNRTTAYTRFLQQRSRNLAESLPHLSAQERMKIIVEEWKVSDRNAHTTRRRRVEPAQPSQTRTQSSRESQSTAASANMSTATVSSGSGTDQNQGSSSTLTHEDAPSMSPSRMRNRSLRSSGQNNPPAPNLQQDQKEQEIPQPQQQRPDNGHRNIEE